MESNEELFQERDKGSIIIPLTRPAMPNIALNLHKILKMQEPPFQVAKTASEEPVGASVNRKIIPAA